MNSKDHTVRAPSPQFLSSETINESTNNQVSNKGAQVLRKHPDPTQESNPHGRKNKGKGNGVGVGREGHKGL